MKWYHQTIVWMPRSNDLGDTYIVFTLGIHTDKTCIIGVFLKSTGAIMGRQFKKALKIVFKYLKEKIQEIKAICCDQDNQYINILLSFEQNLL